MTEKAKMAAHVTLSQELPAPGSPQQPAVTLSSCWSGLLLKESFSFSIYVVQQATVYLRGIKVNPDVFDPQCHSSSVACGNKGSFQGVHTTGPVTQGTHQFQPCIICRHFAKMHIQIYVYISPVNSVQNTISVIVQHDQMGQFLSLILILCYFI